MQSESKFVCAECFEDLGIRDFIEQNAMSTRCSFCDVSQNDVAVASFYDVVEHIETSLFYEWDNADNWLGYESREGGYQGYWVDTEELLRFETELELPRDVDDKLMDQIVDLLPDYAWCELDPYTINDRNRAKISWEIFCDVVKHRNRYFFEEYDDEIEYGAYSPGQIMRKLFESAEQYDLFKRIPKGKTLFRARFQEGETAFTTAKELGPPPREKAIQSNRMSPAGIPMFYASDRIETALRETANEEGKFAVGRFKTCRSMTLLDLTKIPSTPSLFQSYPETLEFRPREVLRFLNHIATEISKPIEKDDKVHINYVPTQVVTEFVRSRLTAGKHRIDGIKYESAARKGHASYVIFATQTNVADTKGDSHESRRDQWLVLKEPTQHYVSHECILNWKEYASSPAPSKLPLFDAMPTPPTPQPDTAP